MNIIYYCFAGAHASVVAAAIHCGLLPAARIPAAEEFLALCYYDKTKPALIGHPYFMGRDEGGNDIYFIGFWNQRDKLTEVIQSFLTLGGRKTEEYILQDAFPLITFATKCGGLLSKRLAITDFGRSLTIWGMRRQYGEFVRMVEQVKDRCKTLQKKE